MKKFISVAVLAIVCMSAFAQKVPQSSSYSELKKVYSPRNYTKSNADPYSVFWIGLESFGAAGTGQLIMKETGRGWAFLGTSVAMSTAMSVVASKYYDLGVKTVDGKFEIPDENKDKADNYLVALGCMVVAQVGINLWSCIDAVRIAKVKNQYYQDLAGKKHFSANMHPSINLAQTATGAKPTAGMTLAIQF